MYSSSVWDQDQCCFWPPVVKRFSIHYISTVSQLILCIEAMLKFGKFNNKWEMIIMVLLALTSFLGRIISVIEIGTNSDEIINSTYLVPSAN